VEVQDVLKLDVVRSVPNRMNVQMMQMVVMISWSWMPRLLSFCRLLTRRSTTVWNGTIATWKLCLVSLHCLSHGHRQLTEILHVTRQMNILYSSQRCTLDAVFTVDLLYWWSAWSFLLVRRIA